MSLPSRSFRLVCEPSEIPLAEALLRAQGFDFIPEPFLGCARRLTAEPFPLGRSLAAFFGFVYIQDRSSMLPPVALAPSRGARVLDMCASPGSKTGLLAQMTGDAGCVLGNEPSHSRLATLRRNMQTLNLIQTATCSWSGEAIPLPSAEEGQGFDFIQLDPPCSGWGTVEKNPNVMDIWKDDKIRPLIALQQKLLTKAAVLLRPGGRLVYSTCTTNENENEAQVEFARSLGLKSVPLTPPQGFILAEPKRGLDGVWRVDDADDGQGFFIAAFTKDGQALPSYPQECPATAARETVPPHFLEEAGIDAKTLPPGEVAVFKNAVYFLPQSALEHLPAAVRWQGFCLGKYSGGRILPSPRFRKAMDLPRLETDDINQLTALIAGQSLSAPGEGREAALVWRGLPLGRVRLKNGRALWSEK